MKIEDFTVQQFSIPFVKPFITSAGTLTHREGYWITLSDGSVRGIGEAAPLPGFSKETLQEVRYALEGFHQAAEGEYYDRDELLSLIQVHTEEIPSARFALETAVFDILAQQKNIPLAKVINPKATAEVAVNGIAGIHFPGEGFSVMKVKTGFRNLFDEMENMEYLTQSYGADVQFRLDCNGAFDLPRAIRFCKEMERFNIDYVEQPLPADALEDLAELRFHTKIPIAVDESLTDYSSAEMILESQAAEVFIIKPMVSGGFIECENIIKLIQSENIRTVITSSFETQVGRTSCLHLTAANHITEACGLATGELLNEPDSIQIKLGQIEIPQLPGLGVSINEELEL